MCAIIGSFNCNNTPKRITNALRVLKNRGMDGFGIATGNQVFFNNNSIKIGNNAIAHRLHSIVNHVKQPLIRDGCKFVANCEIYNWKELSKQHGFKASNDAELLFSLIKDVKVEHLDKVLKQVDGVYALALWRGDEVILLRDVLGIKPLWYAYGNGFEFASERKALESYNATELNPRQILVYNLKTGLIKQIQREFFKTSSTVNEPLYKIKAKLIKLIEQATKKRLTDKKIGLLFSGGIDSVILAMILKKLGVDFYCYTAAVDESSVDVLYAKKAAIELNLNLKIKVVKLSEVENYLQKVVPLIEDANVPKVGVALPLYVACQMAKKDNVKVIFSGLGSDDIFAGYYRHKGAANINDECLSSLRKLYERDTYRDDVLAMNNNIEIRLPFLDKSLVEFALRLPARLKIKDGIEKWVLRQAALSLGLSKIFALRKKKATQYGSGFDSAIRKLAKSRNFQYKSDYLQTFYKKKNFSLAALCSSGKDSLYAMYVMLKQNYDVKCLVTLKSVNPDSFMFHTPNIHMAEVQARALNLPIIVQTTKGEKENELKDMEQALKIAKDRFKVQGVVVGAIFSQYQRERVEKVCDKLGLYLFAPLWHKNQEVLLKEMLSNNFKIMITKIAAWGMDKTWLGKIISTETLNNLIKLNEKHGINVAGEGGEYESLVLDAPMFNKKIQVKDYKIVMENDYTGEMLIKRADLETKS